MTEAITTSLLLALLTVVRHGRAAGPDDDLGAAAGAPRATRLVEFLCLLPLTIPALVIVVGHQATSTPGSTTWSATRR